MVTIYRDIDVEKALYQQRFSVVLDDDRSYQHTGGRRLAGWDNLELGLKWEASTSVRHEFVLSPALFATFPTSSTKIIPHQAALRPMLLYAKGFGDLRVPWLRPFAIQGDVGYGPVALGCVFTHGADLQGQCLLVVSGNASVQANPKGMAKNPAGWRLRKGLFSGHFQSVAMGGRKLIVLAGVIPGHPGRRIVHPRSGSSCMRQESQVHFGANVIT